MKVPIYIYIRRGAAYLHSNSSISYMTSEFLEESYFVIQLMRFNTVPDKTVAKFQGD